VTRFRILPARSRVWIEARSNVHAINTEADGLEGWLDVDMGDHKITGLESRGRVEFPVANLKSGKAMEDREMQRRIDARGHPTIAGDLRTIASTHEPMRYLVRGDVTFRGVTRAYEDEMTLEKIDDRTIGLNGESTFDIRDFGMEPPRILLLKVHPEVVVRVRIVAEEELPPV
jgi:polyisoprenoid-binding protein YceI